MNARSTASLVLKLFGIYVLFGILGYLPIAFSAVNLIRSADSLNLDTFLPITLIVGMPFLHLVSSFVLILKSDAIARRLVPDEQTTLSPGIDADTIRSLAFCIIGVFFLMKAFPKFTQFAINYVVLKRMDDPKHSYTLYGQFAALVVQIVIGAALFLQADGLSRLWKNLREAKGIQGS